MPSVAASTHSLDGLKSSLRLTFPTPSPLNNAELHTTSDINREEDLLRNPSSFRHWWSAIQSTKDACTALQKAAPPSDLEPKVAALLGPLASPVARLGLQRLTYLYESALAQFPGSFKLWKSYLHTRMGYILGKFVQKKRAGGKKKFPEMKDALEDEKEDLEEWEGGLDGIVGYEEWKNLVATFERALMWLPHVCFFPLRPFKNRLTDVSTCSYHAYGFSTSQSSPILYVRPSFHTRMHAEHTIVRCVPCLLRCTTVYGYDIFYGRRNGAVLPVLLSTGATSMSTPA